MAQNNHDTTSSYGGGTGGKKTSNILPLWGNKATMNINNLILTNIQSSNYFRNDLQKLKTFHEVVDEIYNQVAHLEPWEKGSRKLSGQTGMCGGVRGVGAGGIVSSSFSLLFKLFTMRLTRKQVNNLINHADSPYIRGLGFMYIRFCQPPEDLYDWFKDFLDDAEMVDLRAGGGKSTSIGEMCKLMLTRQEWFGTLFPRIPHSIQKILDGKMQEYAEQTTTQSTDHSIDHDLDNDDEDTCNTSSNSRSRKRGYEDDSYYYDSKYSTDRKKHKMSPSTSADRHSRDGHKYSSSEHRSERYSRKSNSKNSSSRK